MANRTDYNNNRISFNEYFMEIAKIVSKRSGCNRRKVGTVIVSQDNQILATGYNASPVGIVDCINTDRCLRVFSDQAKDLDKCMSVHAEMNAIAQCAKYGIPIEGAKIYVTTFPCINCMKAIINAGIKEIVYLENYNDHLSWQLANHARIKIKKYSEM